MPSVEDFLSVVRSKGLARSEKFRVEISGPAGLTAPEDRLLTLFCEEAAFPGQTINTRIIREHNLSAQRPSTIDYGGDATFTFIIDSDWSVKNYFDTWMSLIIGGVSGTEEPSREVAYFANIVGTITVVAVNEKSEKSEYIEEDKHTITLYDVYPKVVNNIQTGNSSIGIQRVSVTFAFRYWTKK